MFSVKVICNWDGEIPHGRPVQPVGWWPKLPPQFRGNDDYCFDEGSIWGPEGEEGSAEEAALTYLGEIEVGESLVVPITELVWIRPTDARLVASVEVGP